MTNFRTVSLDVITEYRLWFGISDIKVLAVERKERFLMKYVNSANGLCQLFGVGSLSQYKSYVYFCFYLFACYFLLPCVYGEIKLCGGLNRVQ